MRTARMPPLQLAGLIAFALSLACVIAWLATGARALAIAWVAFQCAAFVLLLVGNWQAASDPRERPAPRRS